MSALRRNFVYKFLSLIIAILLYWIASGQRNNPAVKGEFYVQPAAEGVPADLILKSKPQGSSVSVSGTAAAVDAFRAMEPKATVDLSGGKVGADRYPVRYLKPPGYADSLEIIGPPLALVTLEPKKSFTFFVDVLYNNNPPAGYEYSDAKSTPAAVQVVGRKEDVSRVQRVVANLDTGGLPGAISQNVEVVAQDLKKQPVENVEIIPKQVHATLGLKKAPATKTVFLSIDIAGSPDPAYEMSGYEFYPNLVTVSGSPELLASLSALRVPVDVEGIKRNTTKTVTIQAPAGLRIVGGSTTVRLSLKVRARATASPAPAASPKGVAPSPSPAVSTPMAAATP
jgi:YbbR domain-containing protein